MDREYKLRLLKNITAIPILGFDDEVLNFTFIVAIFVVKVMTFYVHASWVSASDYEKHPLRGHHHHWLAGRRDQCYH